MKKITLNLTRLIEAGQISQQEADRLQSLAEPNSRISVIRNVFMILGAIAVSAGVIALEPSATMGLLLAVIALGGGAILFRQPQSDWRVLSHGLIIMGALGLVGWIFWQCEETWIDIDSWMPHFAAFSIFTICAVVFRQPFLAALSPLALGAIIGSGTSYWHASYGIFVQEATISILLFAAVAYGLYFLRDRIAEKWEGITTAMARVSFFMINFAFWVGSLWGDKIGEHWIRNRFKDDVDWDTRRYAMEAWEKQAISVPETVFTFGWAVFLGICIWLGTKDHRRFLANTAVTFLAIHFYTQLFESLGASPMIFVLSGLTMVGVAFGVARFDNWQKQRTPTPT